MDKVQEQDKGNRLLHLSAVEVLMSFGRVLQAHSTLTRIDLFSVICD